MMQTVGSDVKFPAHCTDGQEALFCHYLHYKERFESKLLGNTSLLVMANMPENQLLSPEMVLAWILSGPDRRRQLGSGVAGDKHGELVIIWGILGSS